MKPPIQPLGHILSVSWDVNPEGPPEVESFEIGVLERTGETFLTLTIPGSVPPFAKAYSMNEPIARALFLVTMQYQNLDNEVKQAVASIRPPNDEGIQCSV